MLQRVIGLLTLLVIMYGTGGYFVTFHSRRVQNRKHVLRAENMRESDLVVLTFDRNSEVHQNLEWENRREFRHQGIMYDVVKTKDLENDQVQYICIKDEKETELLVAFEQNMQRLSDINGTNIPAVFFPKMLPQVQQKQLTFSSEPIISRFAKQPIVEYYDTPYPPPDLIF